MQEHIRRAHPNHYIPKLPATEESFLMMVNTPLDQRAQLNPQSQAPAQSKKHLGQSRLIPDGHKFFRLTANTAELLDRDIYVADASSPVTPRTIDDAHPAAATAAVALAQLHHHRLASDWESEMVGGVV
jgi:hypothetical protein